MKKSTKLEEITNKYANHQHLYIYGMAGVGKTETIHQFEKVLVENDVVYLDMNHESEQQEVLRQIDKRTAGTLIIDNFEQLEEEKIKSEVYKQLKQNKNAIRIVIVSRKEPSEELYENIYKEKIGIVNGEWPALDKKDIATIAMERDIKLTKEQLENIYYKSGGHPGITEIFFHIIMKSKSDTATQYLSCHPMIHDYIKKNLWEPLTQQQKKVCQQFAYYPQICIDDIADKEQYWTIESLKNLSILKEIEKNVYGIPKFMQDFLEETGIIDKNNNEIYETIGDRMRTNGKIKYALECYYKSRSKEKHRACMNQIFDKVFWKIDSELLKKYMEFSMQEEETAKAMFLRGMLLLNEGKIEETKHILDRLCEKDDEIYLNLLYYNPQVTICEWLDIAEKTVKKNNKKIHLYSFNNAFAGCLGAVKDMSELFCHKKKQIDIYRRQWNTIFTKEQQEYFILAEIEYLVETNNMKDAAEQMKPLLIVDANMDSGKKEILFGLMCALYARGYQITGYELLLEKYYSELVADESDIIKNNVIALKAIYDTWNKNNVSYNDIYFENKEEDYQKINRQNCFYLFYKVKHYLFTKQYENAYMLSERLKQYFENFKLYRYQTECMIAKAATAYVMNRENEAIKILITALPIADKYRYVGMFSLYGTPGKKLLDKYLKTMGEWDNSYNWKKSYYYGNVVGVSFENYMKVLRGAVKKNTSRYPYNRMNQKVEYETLTATEISILQYIEQGYSNAAISEVMNIKLTTVKTHAYNIYKKLDVKSRVQAVQKGKELGVLAK